MGSTVPALSAGRSSRARRHGESLAAAPPGVRGLDMRAPGARVGQNGPAITRVSDLDDSAQARVAAASSRLCSVAVKIRSSTPMARPGFREKTCVGGFSSEFTGFPEFGERPAKWAASFGEERLDIAQSLLLLGQRPVIVRVEPGPDDGPGFPHHSGPLQGRFASCRRTLPSSTSAPCRHRFISSRHAHVTQSVGCRSFSATAQEPQRGWMEPGTVCWPRRPIIWDRVRDCGHGGEGGWSAWAMGGHSRWRN